MEQQHFLNSSVVLRFPMKKMVQKMESKNVPNPETPMAK
jgi:hypothetical protein